MKISEALAHDAEFQRVLVANGCDDLTELLAEDADERDWEESCKAMERAESYHFERNDEHRYEMEWQDAAGLT